MRHIWIYVYIQFCQTNTHHSFETPKIIIICDTYFRNKVNLLKLLFFGHQNDNTKKTDNSQINKWMHFCELRWVEWASSCTFDRCIQIEMFPFHSKITCPWSQLYCSNSHLAGKIGRAHYAFQFINVRNRIICAPQRFNIGSSSSPRFSILLQTYLICCRINYFLHGLGRTRTKNGDLRLLNPQIFALWKILLFGKVFPKQQKDIDSSLRYRLNLHKLRLKTLIFASHFKKWLQ